MTDNDKHTLSDEELDAYLDGRHEVSAAHQAMEKTGSPPALDEKILAHARESVAGSVRSKGDIDRFYRPYAVAATVCLCVTIAFMLLNEPPPSGSAALDEVGASMRPAAQRVLEEEAGQAQPALQRQAASEPQSPAAITSNAAGLEADAVVRAGDGDAAAELRAPDQLQTLATQAQESAGEAVAADGDSPARSAQGFAAESVSLAGARQETPAYRNERQAWLLEIQRLRQAGDDARAETESGLFLASYPDTNLEQALQDLQEQ